MACKASKNNVLYIIIAFVFIAGNCFGQDGVLDSAFGLNGTASIFFEYAGSNVSLIIQPNGKIVEATCGYIADPAINYYYYDFAIGRFKSNGIIDNSFGINGIAMTNIPIIPENVYAGLETDGKIVVGGVAESGGFAVLRCDSDGTIDNTFNDTGVAITQFIPGEEIFDYGLIVQPDGKILQGGTVAVDSVHKDFALLRLNSDGTLDQSFGNGGILLTSFFKDTSYCSAYWIALQPDGKILQGGEGGGGYFVEGALIMVRYNADGTLDTTFGNGGEVLDYTDSIPALAMALQSNGKIITTSSYYSNQIALLRFNADGSKDSTFGIAGRALVTIPEPEMSHCYPNGLAVQQDGKILMAGVIDDSVYSPNGSILVRFDTTGTIDNSFGKAGIVIDTISYQYLEVTMQQDGKIVTSGATEIPTYGVTATRYLSGLTLGILDFPLKQKPILIYPNPIQAEAILQYTLTQNETLSITLYDMQGRQVQTFFTNQTRTQGEHSETLCFNPNLAAGSYILSISNASPTVNSNGRGAGEQGIKIIKQ